MELSELIERLKSSFLIIAAVQINKEDGEIVETFGEPNGKINDIGAFLGSAGEVIFNRLQLESPDYAIFNVDEMNIILINEKTKFTIFRTNGSTNGIYESYMKASKEKSPEIITKTEPIKEPAVVQSSAPSDFTQTIKINKIGEIERKLLSAKITQLNYLVEEFSKGASTEKWNSAISGMISSVPELKEALTVTNRVSINDIIAIEITREEIQIKTKILIDGICRKAVEEYGAADAKKLVQNVIEKLSKK